MKITRSAVLLAALTLATPGLASAAERSALQNVPGAPVSVETSESIAFLQPPLDYRIQSLTTERVRFVNRAAVPATDVAFQVVRNGRSRIVDDRGSFAPGVAITRTISKYDGASYLAAPQTWTVVSVRFADGTSWSAKPAPSVATTK